MLPNNEQTWCKEAQPWSGDLSTDPPGDHPFKNQDTNLPNHLLFVKCLLATKVTKGKSIWQEVAI